MSETSPPEQNARPGAWHTMPERWYASIRSGRTPSSYSNLKIAGHTGIYRSHSRGGAVCLSPFCLNTVRRYPTDPVRYDAVLVNPATGETIEVTQADAGTITQAINDRCGYPRGPLKPAVYGLLATFFQGVTSRQDDC